ALGAYQVHLFVRVVDALARLQGHERHFAALPPTNIHPQVKIRLQLQILKSSQNTKQTNLNNQFNRTITEEHL
ncbi:hypothetical protein, partial [Pseudomonas shirazica]|uniref:hypothetical protein n=1 Tax=Pseudomonas shirazica TaxID=1940636 RepID=UPI00195FB620